MESGWVRVASGSQLMINDVVGSFEALGATIELVPNRESSIIDTPEFTPSHAVCAMLGYPLQEGDGFDDTELNAAKNACDGIVPKLLILFYRYAAQNRRFAQTFDRFLPPTKWANIENHLVFLANDRTHERWGILLCTEYYEQPPVDRTVDGGAWHTVSNDLPFFLIFTLHMNAVRGGLDFCARTTKYHSKEGGFENWSFGGVAGGLTAYSRRNQAVCVGRDMLLAGAKTAKDLRSIERDLGVCFDKPR